MIEPRAAFDDRIDDPCPTIGNHADFVEGDADLAESLRDEADIGILGAARENLVADDKQAGGRGHGRSPFPG